jgi:hypothetical protein
LLWLGRLFGGLCVLRGRLDLRRLLLLLGLRRTLFARTLPS